MMKICLHCPQKRTCTKICSVVEKELSKLNHSLTSVYLVKFVDPKVLEEVCSEKLYKERNCVNGKLTKFGRLIKKFALFLKHSSKRKIKCVALYYGLFGNDLHTQQEIAQKLHVSQTTVRYYLKKEMGFIQHKFSI